MNGETIKGNWMQFKGNMKEEWGKLTDDDLEMIAGRKEQLLGKLQERYGYAKEQAEKEWAAYEKRRAAAAATV